MTHSRSLVLPLGLLLWTGPAFSQASATYKLPAPHAKAGVHCYNCHHEEKPTKKAVASDSCMTCHGDYPAMKEVTRHLPVNPHDSHVGEIACTECHRQHQPPVVKCLECHQGKFKFTAK
jgi:hypothetical protein